MTFSKALPANLATISLASLESTDLQVRNAELARLLEVCETIGFFYLTDHDIPKSLRSRVINASRNFFKLPQHVKQQYGHHAQKVVPNSIRGYSDTEMPNPGLETDKKQIFELGAERPLIPGRKYSAPNVLPPDDVAPDFAKAHLEYIDIMASHVALGLARAFARALGLKETFFTDACTEKLATQRASYYPAHTGLCGRHTDSGLFTIVMQETQVGRSSLKIFSNNQWMNVEAKEELFVVNLANILQVWTNGRFVSTPHHVVHQSDKDRISVPIFFYPNLDTEIVPFGESADEMQTVEEMYERDLSSLWVKGEAGGTWLNACKGREGECECWRCVKG